METAAFADTGARSSWGRLLPGGRVQAVAAMEPSLCGGDRFRRMFGGFLDAFTNHVNSAGLASAPDPDAGTERRPLPPLVVPGAERLVAIGDLHGDLDKARRAFRLAALTDEADRWVGGAAVAVQVGDILDRGDDEVAICYFLERLEREAAAAGGALYILNGNHEVMNAGGDFRYATRGGGEDFLRWRTWQNLAANLKVGCGCGVGASGGGQVAAGDKWAGSTEWEARAAALSPGGPFTRRFFAHRPIALQVGSSVFVHGGLLPKHVETGLERLNQDTGAWLWGDVPPEALGGRAVPRELAGRNSAVWARTYSAADKAACDCETLAETLAAIPGARRMIVGHTIQSSGINSACGGRVLRVDVGMSEGCGDHEPEVLEIRGDAQVVRLAEGAPPEVIAQPSLAELQLGARAAAHAVH
mmetsp:Transcript_23224/g.59512  ORF Transcript_23224/g.59512 Transcript_23224/m.59512 type:complete len:416 (-) Transcript_23224:168-1415(-)|eukprot:jgi/Tetstr1/426777/TSEL_016993.t1